MRARSLLLALALAIGSSDARADEPAKDDSGLSGRLKGEPWELYRTGRELYANGDVAAALGKFARAHELSSEPLLLWNMAACEVRLRHWARGMMLLDRYIASGAASSERDREQTASFRAAARPFVAAVDLASLPAGVTIEVDGEPVGTTPLAGPLYLDAGRRRVHFTRPGYRGLIRTETVAGGTTLVWTVALEPLNVRVLGPLPAR